METTGAPSARRTIGVLANTYEPDAGIWAGGHLHFIQVVKHWRDVDVVLFAPEIARRDLCVALPRCRFVALPALPGKPPKAVDFLFRALGSIAKLSQLRRCDLLLATSHFLPDVLPALLSGRPSAVIVHHILTSRGAHGARRKSLAAFAESVSLLLTRLFASGVIAGSEGVFAELRSRGFRRAMTVTTNGVDHLSYAPATDASKRNRSGGVLIGRLHPMKNVTDAIRAWRIVADRFPQRRLTIIGAEAVPAYAASIRALIADLQLEEHVQLEGVVNDERKVEALEAAELFLFPSGEEGWGIALAEAMRAGLPCVTYDLPIFKEVFSQGRLSAPLGDYRALAERVIEILDSEHLRLSYAAAALELAATFTWRRAAAAEAALIASILGSGRFENQDEEV